MAGEDGRRRARRKEGSRAVSAIRTQGRGKRKEVLALGGAWLAVPAARGWSPKAGGAGLRRGRLWYYSPRKDALLGERERKVKRNGGNR
jgi:hypothetical protein